MAAKTATPSFIADSSVGHEDYRATDTDEAGFDGLILIVEATDSVPSKRPACRCGCRVRTNYQDRVFLQGHDQRLKGKLIRAANVEVTIIQGGVATTTSAEGAARNLLVTDQGIAQVTTAIAKVRAAGTVEPAAAPAAPVLGRVKVGRWFYPARRFADGTVEKDTRDNRGVWVAVDAKVAATFQ